MPTMPSETYYLGDENHEYVRDIRDRRDLDNPSQALQTIVDYHREHFDE